MPDTTNDNRRRIRMVLLAGGGVVLLIAAVSALVRFGAIEEDLERRSREALEDAGITVEDVDFDGRNATLRGRVSSEEERRAAVEIVEGVRGVGTVTDALTVGSAPPGPGEAASIEPGDGSRRALAAEGCSQRCST